MIKRGSYLAVSVIVPLMAIVAMFGFLLHDVKAQSGNCPAGYVYKGDSMGSQPTTLDVCETNAGSTDVSMELISSYPCGGAAYHSPQYDDKFYIVPPPSLLSDTPVTMTLHYLRKGGMASPYLTLQVQAYYTNPTWFSIQYTDTVTGSNSIWYSADFSIPMTRPYLLALSTFPSRGGRYTSFRLATDGYIWPDCPDPGAIALNAMTQTWYLSATWPTPFPTPAPVTITLDITPFWDVDIYLGMVNAAQTLILFPEIQKGLAILVIAGGIQLAAILIINLASKRKASAEEKEEG